MIVCDQSVSKALYQKQQKEEMEEEKEEEEKEEDDEDALFAVSDEDMEDEPVLEVGAS